MEEFGRMDTQEYQPFGKSPSLSPSSMSCDMRWVYKKAILDPSLFKAASGPFKNPARLLPSLSIITEVALQWAE